MKRYAKASKENREYAELIDERLLDDGVYAGEKLPEKNFYKLIKQQYDEVLDIASGGFL